MLSKRIIAHWPGKSAPEGGVEHPALYHMLDVAAVAEVLLHDATMSSARKDAFILLAALHDLGKISDSFRSMLLGEAGQTYRHWELTEVHLNDSANLLLSSLKVDQTDLLAPLISATAGHHGRPSKRVQRELARARITISAQAKSDAASVIFAFADLWPQASLANLTLAEAQHLSWWLSGLVTAADWVGSNTDWFRPAPPQSTVAEYLEQIRPTARRAVKEAGLTPCAVSEASVFDWDELRPMQSACEEIPIPNGPMLAIVEDETGAGKTEAALILAQRMLIAGKGDGLFVGLPTMATADAMFSRVSKSLGRMFFDSPTLTLAHGRAGLSAAYNDVRIGAENSPEDVSCTDWLADHRRRALLANVGIGTIDQALLSVLPVKFQTLRHYGLSSKILIVDEVHELGEPYIAVMLETLLRMHRNAGGSAILLTATLPLHLRKSLLAVYGAEDDQDPAYPALTVAKGSVRRDLPKATGAKGAVEVKRLVDAKAALDLIREKSQLGAACVWIRNAVDDAIAAVKAFREMGIDAELLHARFTLGDRKCIEHAALDRFGKSGTGREGRILVGTQVLESSLDLDFDVMVTDLAPMAGLVQRAGRLWRHMDLRPCSRRAVPSPVLYVLSPDPQKVSDAYWLTRVLDKGAYVYPVDLVWRTALRLFEIGEIKAPSGIRSLIESSYGDATEVPEPLTRFEIERLGSEYSHKALAWQNVVDIDNGYRAGGQANDDATYPTRLGQPQRSLLLVRWKGSVLVPWNSGADGIALSEVSAAAHKLDSLDLPIQSQPEIEALTHSWPDWKKAALTVCPVTENGEICDGLRYDRDYGLMF